MLITFIALMILSVRDESSLEKSLIQNGVLSNMRNIDAL